MVSTSLILAVCLVAAEPAIAPGRPPADRPFARLMRETHFVAPGLRALSPPSDETRPAPRRLLADFECDGPVVVAGDRLRKAYPELLADLMAALLDANEVISLSADEVAVASRLSTKIGTVPVRPLRVATDTVWVRDFGPVWVESRDGTTSALDFQYRRISGEKDRTLDDQAGRAIAQGLEISVDTVGMTLEGGNLLANGRGLVLTTLASYNENIAAGFDAAQVDRVMAESFGADQVVILEPLLGEPTGHVDAFACFTDAITVLVGAYEPQLDPMNAALLDRNAARLAAVFVGHKRLRVIRVSMPPHDDGAWRTYTNLVFTKGAVLLPDYGDAHAGTRRQFEDALRSLLPDRRVRCVDASRVIRDGGSLRCITLVLPR